MDATWACLPARQYGYDLNSNHILDKNSTCRFDYNNTGRLHCVELSCVNTVTG